MSDEGPDMPPDGQKGEGFVLLEGWMFGALMYPPAIDHARRIEPANDNDDDREDTEGR